MSRKWAGRFLETLMPSWQLVLVNAEPAGFRAGGMGDTFRCAVLLLPSVEELSDNPLGVLRWILFTFGFGSAGR